MNVRSSKRSKKWWWLAGGLLLVAVAVLVVGLIRGRTRLQSPLQTGEIVSAFVGDLAANATASGRVVARRNVQLALLTSGTVAEVYVAAGDQVEAGAPLLKLETAELERAVESARQNLTVQEANLAALLAPAATAELANAEAAVISAQASLDDLLAGPSAEEVTAAEADVRVANADVAAAQARLNALTATASPEEIRAAEIELELAQQAATQAAEQHSTVLVTEPNNFLSAERLAEMEFAARTAAVRANADLAAAQEALDQLLNGDPDATAAARAGLAVALAQRDAAQARLDMLLQGPSAAEIAQAEAQLAQAKASLDQLRRGPSETQIAVAEIQVEQARIALQRAENNLTRATLTVPFAGAVTAVHVSEGEMANGTLVEMVDGNDLEVVLDVDEVDVGAVAVGQTALVTLESWPDESIESRITSIAPRATSNNSAIVSFEVYLALDEIDLPIRVGMTANASLVTATRQDVLLVPNEAIMVDRNSGTYSVNKVQVDAEGNQTIEEVPITIGLRDDKFTQIISGLQAGDRLMVGAAGAPRLRFGPGNGSGPFGGS
ncbi:MAG TPA: efflux RND transporter periplasmic adaptor subunit [Anaerolineae bacterium]